MTTTASAIAAVTHLGKPPSAAIVGGYLVLTDGFRLLAIAGAELPAGLELLGPSSIAVLPEHFARATNHTEDVALLRAWCGGPYATTCEDCDGTGKANCWACEGTGQCSGECARCGASEDHDCERCDGTGKAKCDHCYNGFNSPEVEGRIYGGGINRTLLHPLLELIDTPRVDLGVADADTFPVLVLVWPGHRAVLMGLRSTQDDAAVWPFKKAEG